MIQGKIAAVDLFCGAGGLSTGLSQAGIRVAAGVDIDEACRYPYEHNVGAAFVAASVRDVTGDDLASWWGTAPVRLLAGCAPCQPFSSQRKGADTRGEAAWDLLGEFTRLVVESAPDFVTMENVPRLRRQSVFQEFVAALTDHGYHVDIRVMHGPDYGLPQTRRRLALAASQHGPVRLPRPTSPTPTVRQTIGGLPPLAAGQHDPSDPLHFARALTELNLARMRASKPGGTWLDWPEELRASCQRKAQGASFKGFYGRMVWDEPSPTITTQSFNYGTGRFGHPEQDRTLTLREAALLQGFPKGYQFARPGEPVHMTTVGRMIGNAVPPPLGRAIGQAFVEALDSTHGDA